MNRPIVEARPRPDSGSAARLAEFRRICERAAGRSFGSPQEFHAWSVECYRDFWRLFLESSGLTWEGAPTLVCVGEEVESAIWFPEVRLNYAENLLRPLADADDDARALTSVHGPGNVEHLTRRELRNEVRATAAALADLGITVGDRVAVIAPNSARTVVVALALAALGATTATATPDMGTSVLVSRMEQVEPSLLIIDRPDTRPTGAWDDAALARLLDDLPSVRRLLVLDDRPLPATLGVAVDRLSRSAGDVREDDGPTWPRLPFNHPLWVMFSSGTTGPPKAMVHGAGGSLLEHVKEHVLHGDLRADDVLFFHTTTAWMMWNWQLSALAVGAHVVLYDGPLSGPQTLWQVAAEQGVTVFGTSPAYLQLCQDADYHPRADVDLGGLRAVLSTGAVLHDWQFDWVRREVGPVALQSISGGTDIIGCFVLGHPERPVQPGRCQSLSLGLDVAALDDAGIPVIGEVGDLVCRRPFPSRPLYFLRDPDGRRFHASYFADHPGVWTHGDRIEIGRDGSARMHGRADGVLNIGGIRIGPAEIYRILRGIPGIADGMAVEQREPGGSRLVLLVVLRSGHRYDEELAARIRSTLRREGGPAHVPQVIAPVAALPVTHNGKRSESAARDALNGDPVRNLHALSNPDSLDDVVASVRDVQSGSEPVEEQASEDPLVDAVQRAFADVLRLRSVPRHANFFDLGGTSRQCMTILRRLRFDLRRPVTLDAFLADPTVQGLADALHRPVGESSRFSVIREGCGAGRPTLYLVHGVYGDVDAYRTTLEHLDTDMRVVGIEAALTHDDGTPKTVPELAAEHVEALQSFQPSGRICLVGYSFGGLVAFEMARQLAAAGRTPDQLVLLDVRPPKAGLTRVQREIRKVSSGLVLLLPFLGSHSLRTAIVDRLRGRTGGAERDVVRGGFRLFHAYEWGSYDGAVTYLRARVRVPVVMNQMHAWRTVAPRLTVVGVPGRHEDLLSAGNAPELAARVSEALGTVR